MPTLSVFNSISMDGYFTGANGDLSWAYSSPQDDEWRSFVSGNAGGGGPLLCHLRHDGELLADAGRGTADAQGRRGHESRAQVRVLTT